MIYFPLTELEDVMAADDGKIVKVPAIDYRVSDEAAMIYRSVVAAISLGHNDPRVGRDMAVSVAFSAAIREALRLYGVQTTIKLLQGYAETTAQADVLNRMAEKRSHFRRNFQAKQR